MNTLSHILFHFSHSAQKKTLGGVVLHCILCLKGNKKALLGGNNIKQRNKEN